MKYLTPIRLFITLILISFILWFRIFKERLSLNLEGLTSTEKLLIMIISASLIIIHLIILISILGRKNTSLLKKLYNITPISALLKIITFILEAPKILYNEYSEKYDLLTKEIEITASYIVAYFNHQKILLAIFYYLPRIFVAIIFLIDIFLFKRFHYFYMSLILLLIPLCSRIYLYMVFYQSKLMYEFSEIFLDIKKIPNCVEINLKTTPTRGKTLDWMINKYDFLKDTWFIGKKLNNYDIKKTLYTFFYRITYSHPFYILVVFYWVYGLFLFINN